MVYRITPGDAVRPGRRPAVGLPENQGKGEIKDSSGKNVLPPPLSGQEKREGGQRNDDAHGNASPVAHVHCVENTAEPFFPCLGMLPAPDALISVQKTVILRFMVKFSAFVFVREGKVS